MHTVYMSNKGRIILNVYKNVVINKQWSLII